MAIPALPHELHVPVVSLANEEVHAQVKGCAFVIT